jgi:tetratricopeptide (TPR) repeat protein
MNLDTALAQLENAHLVRRLLDPDLAYIFKHVLTQETAYQSLLVKKRREIHRHVAEYYERLCSDSDNVGEVAALLAHHYIEAGDDAKTLLYATLAGDVAMQRYANAEAVVQYSRALEIALRSAPSAAQFAHLYTKRGRALELSGQFEQALANYDEMDALGRQRGDQALQLASLITRATIRATYTPLHDAPQGQALLDQALALARDLGDRRAEAKVLWNLMLLHHFITHPREAAAYGEQSLAIARELGLQEQLAYTLNDIFRSYVAIGQLDRARAALKEARELWQTLDNVPMLIDNRANLTILQFFVGEYDQAIAESEEADRLSGSIGNPWGQAHSRLFLGAVYLERGELARAVEIIEECTRLGKQAGFIGAHVIPQADLAWLYGMVGAFERGLELARLVLTRAETHFRYWQPVAAATLVRLHLLDRDLAEAEAAYQAAGLSTAGERFLYHSGIVSLAEGELRLAQGDPARTVALMDGLIAFLGKAGAHTYLADAQQLKGRALLALEQIQAAYKAFQAARVKAEALGSRRTLWQILFALSQIEAQRGNLTEADALRAQARAVVAYIADHVDAPELRASFLTQPHVRAVLESNL